MNQYWISETYRECVAKSAQSVVRKGVLRGKRVLVTGASGLVGSFMTDVLIELGGDVFAAGRNTKKLETRFPKAKPLHYDLAKEITFQESFDYIVHGAGYGHPAAFRKEPVDVLLNSVNGTAQVLQYATERGVGRVLYISSGEVYGNVDSMNPRACYPLGKQAGENLCASYRDINGLETVVARLCHTFGPGISERDNRAASQFFIKAAAREDIVLNSKGEQRRSYLFVADSVSAMLSVLTSGESGAAYDIASEECVVTIAGLAEMIAMVAGVNVQYEVADETGRKEQSPIKEQVLDGSALAEIGWEKAYSLQDGVERTIHQLC